MGVMILVPQLLGEEKRFPIAIVTAAKAKVVVKVVHLTAPVAEGTHLDGAIAMTVGVPHAQDQVSITIEGGSHCALVKPLNPRRLPGGARATVERELTVNPPSTNPT